MTTLKAVVFRISGLCLVTLAVCAATIAQEQPLKISYRLAMSRPSSHLFEVSIDVDIPADAKIESLALQMPKWSPGRYAVFDFAKNVQEVNARISCLTQYDERGNPLPKNCPSSVVPVVRVDDQTWRPDLPGNQSATLTFKYKVFGDDLSGTFSELDSGHANCNGGSIFMYVAGHKQDPVGLAIDPPKDWRIVNGWMQSNDQREWQFPNWDLMIDTPTEIAPDWTEDNFKVGGKTYHVVVHSFGNEGGKRSALVRDIEKIVRAETAMWGPPEFDQYTFMIHFAADGHSGDGMEHLTSTQVIMPGALGDPGMYEETLDTVAHEFFHVWNVKRLRPVELGPWDFTRPANTRALWIAEGITNYYGHLMQRRAGLWNDNQLLSTLNQQITELEDSPGSRLMSAEESSLAAPFTDDAPHAQKTNLANSSISYYPKGEVLGLVLDLLIRGKTGGKASLDDVMRRMYEEFYLKSANASYYLRGRGYRTEDFEHMVSEVAGADLSEFFKRYVRGVESPPYEDALAQVGLRLAQGPQQPITVGIAFEEDVSAGLKVVRVMPNSPAQEAGLEVDDTIVSFGGTKVTSKNWAQTAAKYKPGDRADLTVQRGRRTIQLKITLGPPQAMNYRIEETKDAPAERKALRDKWLTGRTA